MDTCLTPIPPSPQPQSLWIGGLSRRAQWASCEPPQTTDKPGQVLARNLSTRRYRCPQTAPPQMFALSEQAPGSSGVSLNLVSPGFSWSRVLGFPFISSFFSHLSGGRRERPGRHLQKLVFAARCSGAEQGPRYWQEQPKGTGTSGAQRSSKAPGRAGGRGPDGRRWGVAWLPPSFLSPCPGGVHISEYFPRLPEREPGE